MRMRMGIVRVVNDSMLPTYRDGDCLLVAYGERRPRVGDVVLVRRPERVLVKRVAEVRPSGLVTVLSDNRAAGSDSRSFGPVVSEDVIGRVLARYWRRPRWRPRRWRPPRWRPRG